ncbi:MAG: acyl-CoA thioesterase [Verrucomicrobiia bacterium]|jgi:YbgC/YbaW family acyl-CoA thioester hydrolase
MLPNMPEPAFIHPHRISYAATAPANHVYFSRYLEIVEEARGEFFRSLGFPLITLAEEHSIQLPVLECKVKYHRFARYDDEVEVRVRVGQIGRIRLRLEYELFRGEDLLVAAVVDHGCVRMDERATRLPEPLRSALEKA